MKTATVTILTGWRLLLAWVTIAAVIILWWESGKAIYNIYAHGKSFSSKQ
jgi:hypothetical protein